MFETVRDILIHTAEESMAILLSLLSILFIFLVIYWQYNRRRFRKLSHQIPAGVIRDYLDSVIHNSSALKSALFLGDENESGKASVVSVDKLSKNIDTDNFEELNRKNAEIAELREGIGIKDKIIAELEGKLATGQVKRESIDTQGESKALKNEIERLKKELEQQNSGNLINKDDLNKLIQERNNLRDSLKEYELIEDDLTSLKSLQEENRHYKKIIEGMDENLPKEKPSELKKIPEKSKPKENIKHETKSDMGKQDDNVDSEELLKEFERMLG